MESTMMHGQLTLAPLLERAGRYRAGIEIVSRMGDGKLHRYTYADFYRRARALAEALTRAGLRRHDRVATLMWNHHVHLEAYFGIPLARGVLHTLNLRLFPSEIAWIARHAEDRFLIVDDVLLPLLDQFKNEASFERIFVVSTGEKPVPAGYEDYEQFLKTATGDFVPPQIEETEPLGMCYTSGTTGRPRGVVYSHRSTVVHAYNGVMPDHWAFTMLGAMCPVVPMFHANAWGLPYGAVMVGMKQVYPGPHPTAESLLDLFAAENVTVSGGVPTVWLEVLRLLEQNPGRWRLVPGLRLMIGGSAAPEPLIRAFDRHGITVVHAYGLTETSPMTHLCGLKPYMKDLGEDQRYAYRAKQGLATPLVEQRVMAEGKEVPADGKTMGELQLRGPIITGSYYKLPSDPDKFTSDGWFCTGDIVSVDAEGYIKITDRTKDLIKSGGEWISSVDLENAIMGHPAVAEAAVIAMPHPKWDERPLAVVVLKPGAKATKEELRSFLEGKFAKWWLPDDYVFADSIPRTSTGKFLKSKLREMYAQPAAGAKAAG